MTIPVDFAGRRLEFPDGTDPAVIQATVKKMAMSPEAFAQIKADGRQPGNVPAGLETAAQTGMPRDYDAELSSQYDIGQAPYKLGEKVNDFAAKYVPAPFAAGLGALANAGLEGAGMVATGTLGGAAGQVLKKPTEGTAVWLMKNALRAKEKDLLTGKADRAARTMLEEGASVWGPGVEKLRRTGTDLNRQVSQEIAGSTAKTRPATEVVDDAVGMARSKFSGSPNQADDYAAIGTAADKFMGNDQLAGLGAREAELLRAAEQKKAARIAALQDEGRYRTMAAQQENLAHGGGVNLGRADLPRQPVQTVNEPYMNVGATGERALSPSAYPVQSGMVGNPRTPGQYTHNMDRVPEASGAAAEFARIAKLRALEAEIAELELAAYRKAGGSGIPLQTAQTLKQGLHKDLADQYGALKAPEVEAKKMLAHVLRMELEKGAPAIAPLNKRASDIWNAHNVAQRRALVAGNHNPIPLGASVATAVNNPAAALGLWANSSDIAKSYIARALYGAGQIAQPAGRVAGMAAALRNYETQDDY